MNMEAIQIKQVTQHECHNNESRRVLFGKYEMGRLLGQGTFAKVYKCKNIATQENVAIKVIQKEHVRKQGLMEQLKIEISVMHLVKHPNIVELKEVMATKSKVFFVMEFVKGGELFAKVQRGKLKEDVARKYFQQLISAVDYCHSRGVSHRDLKPENLLLDEKEDLKVSDFGLSALPEQHLTDGLLHTACGTPAYIAPEVLRQKGYDGAKADIWSCGVILFVLLSGYLPFQNANLMKMYMKIFKADYECPPWISPHTKSLISKLLVVDPEERITISQIMQTPWFQKGRMETHHLCRHNNLKGEESAGTEHLPRFYNAFEFISSMSPALDLSSLFESKRKCPSMFTSKCPAPLIVGKLKTAAKGLNLEVLSNRDCKVEMQGKVDGRKGKLAVTAEVFEVAPQVAVVEFSKCSGDTLEYTKFCEESIRPAIKDIVWIWQGEHM